MTTIPFHLGDLPSLFLHFTMLSMLAVGGAIAVAPDVHRFVVTDQHWLTDAQFGASIALAQASPGPNLLFVAVVGYNVGGIPGCIASMSGMLLPSTVFCLTATRGIERHRNHPAVRAFTNGLAPITVGLLLAIAWVLTRAFVAPPTHRWSAVGLIALTAITMLRTRLSPVWLIIIGGLIGGLQGA